MTKIRLRQHNSKKIVSVSKLEQNPIAGKVIADQATEKDRYGTDIISGSNSTGNPLAMILYLLQNN